VFVVVGPGVARHDADRAAPLDRFGRDRHPNAAGQRVFADAIGAYVAERNLLAPSAIPSSTTAAASPVR
jgi:hypothetical protein